jgi:hypothetical protein
MSESMIKSRKVRIDIASHAGKSDRDSGRNDGFSGNRGRFEGDDDRTAGDWRSGPPPPPRDDGRKDRYEPPRERSVFNQTDLFQLQILMDILFF